MGRVKNQKGFSVVEGLLILVIIGIIGGAGYYVMKANKNLDATNGKTASSIVTPTVNTGFKTYTNKAAGFSVDYPNEVLIDNGAACTKINYVFDNYGNKVTTAEHYTYTKGSVPATVLQDGDNFYITSAHSYQQRDITRDGTGHTLAASCPNVKTTAASALASLTANTSADYLSVLPMMVKTVKNENEILAWAQDHFKDSGLSIQSIKANAGGWKDVWLACAKDFCSVAYTNYNIRYYDTKNKMVYYSLGQSVILDAPNGKDAYDSQVIDSIKIF